MAPEDTTFTLSDESTISIGTHSGTASFPKYFISSTPDSFAIIDEWQAFRILAHEYGHYVLKPTESQQYGIHLGAMGPYALMEGTLPFSERARTLVSGFNRLRTGWIDPVAIDPVEFPFDTTFVLRDAVTNGNGAFAWIKTRYSNQTFLLECRSAAKSAYLEAQGSGECAVPEAASGLLITHIAHGRADGDTWGGDTHPPSADPELASGMFSSAGEPDGEEGEDEMQAYVVETADHRFGTAETDLFQAGPGDAGWSNVFGPFTNPSSNLYAPGAYGFPVKAQTVYSGITVYDVEWANEGQDSMYVSIFLDDPRFGGGADTIRTDMTWDGRVQVTGDVVVADGVTLTLTENAQMIAAARQDTNADGLDTTRVEITPIGDIQVEGESDDPVEFTSSRDTDFEHFRDSLKGTPVKGDWWGAILEKESPSALSRFRHAAFEYPVFAISVDSLSGDIFECSFSESDTGDVYVDRDARVPLGSEWSLHAPTDVVFHTQDQSDSAHSGEDPDRNELTIDGALRTLRPAGATGGDSVRFLSKGGSPARGDWAGITVRWNSSAPAKGVLEYASIGFCADPISFVGADSAYIGHSNLHHFEGIGVFDWISNARILDNDIQGSEGLLSSLQGASIGIKALQSRPEIRDNDVYWHKDYGIELEWGKNYCADLEDDETAVEDSVFVADNTVLGEGEASEDFQSGSGISVDWGCRKRHVRLYDNEVRDWFWRGIDLLQCSDTRLKCNLIADNTIGVNHSRNTSQTSGGAVRLRRNIITDSDDVNLWADDFAKLTLYDGGVFAGNNEMQPESTSVLEGKFIEHRDLTASVLDARHTFWRSASGDTLAQSDSTYVRDRITGVDSTLVNLGNFEIYSPGCDPLAANVGPQSGLAPDSPPPPVPLAGMPTSWGLSVESARGSATVELTVPGARQTVVSLSVYDVTGRRVRSLLREYPARPGRVRGQWDYRDEGGLSVASGIYFIQLRADDRTAITRRVIVLR